MPYNGHMIACALYVAIAFQHKVQVPKWFDTMLAGYKLAYDDKHPTLGVYDPATKYFLIRTVDCAGAELTLILTRDRRVAAHFGYELPMTTKTHNHEVRPYPLAVKCLPSLRTGKGIEIGSTEGSIVRALGHPGSRKVNKYVTLSYSGSWHKVTYYADYVLKAGRLIEINFSWSSDEEGV